MKATCWMGKHSMKVRDVPDPKILNPRDAILRVTSTAICGSDLHLYDGFIPTMEHGDVVGHEFMGEVVEVGPEVKDVKVGDRVVNAFPVSCGECTMCQRQLFSVCENSNPNDWMAEKLWGYSPAAIYGYSHMLGGYAGGQAQYARVAFADVGLQKVPKDIPDEKVLFLSDIFPTGYMAAENCDIEPGDVVAVWGCGPVGQFAIRSAYLLGASRVIAIDSYEYRLRMAREGGAETLNYTEVDVPEALKEMTAGRGPDACIEAVGMEAHSTGMEEAYDKAKHVMLLQNDRGGALREAINACRPAGNLSVAGVFSGYLDKVPFGAIMNKSLTVKTGQAHVQRYMQPLLDRVLKGEIDPSFVVTHQLPLDEAPRGYEMFAKKQDDCVKVVLKP